jgi:hypothetical protein
VDRRRRLTVRERVIVGEVLIVLVIQGDRKQRLSNKRNVLDVEGL